MNSRDEILGRLRERESAANLPGAWKSERNFPDLVLRFTESLTKAKGEVRRLENLKSALTEVDRILHEVSAKTVVVNDEPPFSDFSPVERWPTCEWHLAGETTGNLRDFCARADVGLSAVQGALAETGSLIVHSGDGKSRLATLLPPIHVALVPVSCLVPDIFIWAAARNGEMPANLILISGPSKSADIEFTLTLGVHGPRRLIAVLYEG